MSASFSVSRSSIDFGDDVGAPADRIKHRPRRADALGDRHADIFQNRQAAEQPVDLERARDAELDPLGLRLVGDVAAGEQHAALRSAAARR